MEFKTQIHRTLPKNDGIQAVEEQSSSLVIHGYSVGTKTVKALNADPSPLRKKPLNDDYPFVLGSFLPPLPVSHFCKPKFCKNSVFSR